MTDTMRELKQQYGHNSPEVAEQLNSIGAELTSRGGDARMALKLHQEALTILDWNKCNALLFDFVKKSKQYAIGMALTLRKIGNILREMNNFVGAAEVYKECLDMFLEGLIEGGGALKRKLLECEYKKDPVSYQVALDQVDRQTIGRIMCLHPEFRAVVRDIWQLFREMQCVKFVGQNAASSRRRRRMHQYAAMEENLKNAVESLSMTSSPSSKTSCDNEIDRQELSRSKSDSSVISADSETWMNCFWEKEMGRYSRPRPLARRSITSDAEYDHYKALSSMIVPGEKSLATALERFPLPASIAGNKKPSSEGPRVPTPSLLHTLSPSILPAPKGENNSKVTPCVSIDSIEVDSQHQSGPPHLTSLSPVSVVRFRDGNSFKLKDRVEL